MRKSAQLNAKKYTIPEHLRGSNIYSNQNISYQTMKQVEEITESAQPGDCLADFLGKYPLKMAIQNHYKNQYKYQFSGKPGPTRIC